MVAQKSSLKTKEEKEVVRTLLSWKAPARPFRKRTRDYYLTIAAIVFFVCVILLFFKEWLLIGVILSLTFVTYVLGTVPPREVEHKITTEGIVSHERAYLWEELFDFWFSEALGQKILNINTRRALPGRIFLLLGDLEEGKVRQVLAKYLPYREVPEKGWTEKAGEWLSQKVPLEKS